MKLDKDIQILLLKFIENKCSKEESNKVVDYFKKNKITDEYPTVEQVMLLIKKKGDLKDKVGLKIFNNIISEVNQQERNKIYKMSKKYLYWKFTAAVMIFIGMGYYFQNYHFTSDQIPAIPEDSITLQLENGDIEIITENGKTKVTDSKGGIVGTQNGNQLVYDQEIEREVLEYNTLTVPYGKRFKILLSDGTKVHLNAGTSLKYPIKFIEGENRQVFLQGEAYFSVTKDANHPFIVNANKIDIRVLGTVFNVSSYPEDKHIHTVLTEGAVSIYDKEDSYNPETAVNLKPGFIASWEKTNNQVTIEKADTEMHTGWMEGKLILEEVAFNGILKKLERQYDVSIINNNAALNDRYFTARFDVEDIHIVMENLSQYASFSYEFNKNQIFINP